MALGVVVRAFVVLVVVAVVLPMVGGVSAASVPVSRVAAPGEVVGEAAASAAAVASGAAVRVADKTSETEEVVANPDGTFTLNQTLRPVRVQRGGEWVPVDLALAARGDGLVAPRAAAVDLRLSDGGDEPLIVVGEDGHEVGLGWSGPLPAPSLLGATATYADVLPGVDLTVTADVEGFTQLLVVKSREAAQHPALRTVRFASHLRGATQSGGAAGLEVRSSDGRLVFTGDASRMWDSAGGRASMGVEVGADSIAVTPDQEFLADPSTVFPVYVDPSYFAFGRKNHHVMVQSAWPGAHNYDRTDGDLGDLKAGFVCAGPCFTSRSYVEMAIGGLPGKWIHSATLAVNVVQSHDCAAAGPTEVWLTNGISWETTWGHEPTWIERQSENNQTNNPTFCPDPNGGATEFPVTAAIRKAAGGGWPTVTFGLKGQDEANDRFWRRFHLNPVLRVWYNSYPDTPDQLSMTSGNKTFPCVTGANRPYLGDATPFLSARFRDADPGMLNARFYWGLTGQAPSGSVGTFDIPPGTSRSVRVPAGVFVDGKTYAWRVQSGDGELLSSFSPFCEVGVDLTAPGAPAVSSPDHPPGSSNAFAGDPATLTFGANGTGDVLRYVYTTDDTTPEVTGSPSVNAGGLGGGASVRVTVREGVNQIQVRSVDRAENPGPVVTYTFTANAARAAVADLPLDRDPGGLTYAGTASAAWTTGYRSQAFRAAPATQDHLVRATPMMDTTKNYSVSAWARIDSSVGYATVVSQDGTAASGFYLQYHDGMDRWSFRATSSDVPTAPGANAFSSKPPEWHVWTHLVGTYDANDHTLRLYVNGALEGETPFTATWRATGPFVVGAAKSGSSRADYFTGAIDDVRAWDRVVGPGEAARLANLPVPRAHYQLDEGSGTTTRDEVSGRAATLDGDAGWDAGQFTPLRLTGNTGGRVSAPAPAVVPGRSFTVSAWVRADATDGSKRVAVGLADPAYSPFLLGYNGEQRRWEFFVVNAGHTASWSVLSSEPATANTWVYLTGVYDATKQTIRLLVNGQEVATQPGVGQWGGGPGELLIGGGTWNSQVVPPWRGLVDDVRLFSGVRDDDGIRDDMHARSNGS